MAYSGQSDWSTMAVYDNKIPENIAVNEKIWRASRSIRLCFCKS